MESVVQNRCQIHCLIHYQYRYHYQIQSHSQNRCLCQIQCRFRFHFQCLNPSQCQTPTRYQTRYRCRFRIPIRIPIHSLNRYRNRTRYRIQSRSTRGTFRGRVCIPLRPHVNARPWKTTRPAAGLLSDFRFRWQADLPSADDQLAIGHIETHLGDDFD